MKELLSRGALLALAVLLLGCSVRGDPSRPVPSVLHVAPQPAQRLVVVLPGRRDNLARLERSGVVGAIQGRWPDADVLLTELSMPFYTSGRAPQRLHREVIQPARGRGYREVWLVGASLGGMGSVLYDRAYPGDIQGIVLLAPFLGRRGIQAEVEAAGGLSQWDAGPPEEINEDNWQRELWRHLQTATRDPSQARRIWLAYGERDYLRGALPLLQPVLPPEHVLVRPGGHTWQVWTPALREVLARASQTTTGVPDGTRPIAPASGRPRERAAPDAAQSLP